jgi:glycosyltransferase involved in cell wall biosynthesis
MVPIDPPAVAKRGSVQSSKRKIRVVRIITASYVVPWHLENTLKRLPKDFEVCVVGEDVSRYKDLYPDVKWVDIEIHRKISLIADLLALFQLCRLFVAYKPDIVHSIMHKAALLTAIAGFICRIPVRVNTFTGQYWATKAGFARAVYYASDWLVNLLNTVCLTDSQSQSDFLHVHGISHAGKPLPVLLKGSLSGVDIERFDRRKLADRATHLRRELRLEEGCFAFLYLARKTRDKGAIDIINAFSSVSRAHSSVRLLFVGPDESNGELESLVRSKPDVFRSVLSINHGVDNREDYLAVSNVLCLPSYKEGFGSIVIDAAALGVPTIGSNIPGLVDSIEDGKTGVLFPAGDIEALAKIMVSTLENRKKFENMGAAAKARVEQYFTADLIYDALKAFYLECISK